jgi:sarcosine oxidase subunit beta
VLVLERNYIGGGNSGRNTTIIRSNYGIPESVRFYQRSVELYQSLEAETGRWIMHMGKGLLWVAHSEAGVRAERARAEVNTAFGARTEFVTPAQIKQLEPHVDLTGGGLWPVLGGSYHLDGATARHDRVVWAYAEGAMRRGVDIAQRVEVTGIDTCGGRVTGVRTTRGNIACGVVLSATGGHVSAIGEMAGVRLPIRTHPLQAYVSSHYAPGFNTIFASTSLGFYLSQTARGEILIGAEVLPYSTYSTRSTFGFLCEASKRAVQLLPVLANARAMRQWAGLCDMTPDSSPILGGSEVPGFFLMSGMGTWGFKGAPVFGRTMAELIATGRTPPLIAPFALDRFRRDRMVPDAASAGTH